MDKNKKKLTLSILIPTRNQPEDLIQTLNSFIKQVESSRLGNEIEIIIGDNSNNNKTQNLLRNLNYSYIKYFKHGKDLGIDKNILFLLEKSKGKLVWFFGDDELKEGGLAYIFKTIKKNPKISFIWINHQLINDKYNSDFYFKDKNEVLEKIANSLAFVSSIILDGSILKKINEAEVKRFISTGLVNLYLTLYAISKGEKFFYVSSPYVYVKPTPPEKHTYDGFKVFAVNFYDIVYSFRGVFSKKAIRKVIAKNFGYLWRGILVGWIRGYNSPRGKLKVLFKLYWSYPEFWLAAPFFIMPKFVIESVYFVYKKIFKLSYTGNN